jgi:hypothetical protein
VEDSEAVVVEADLTQVEAGPAPDIPRDRSAPGEAGFRYASMRERPNHGPAPDIPRDRSAPGEAGFRYACMREAKPWPST